MLCRELFTILFIFVGFLVKFCKLFSNFTNNKHALGGHNMPPGGMFGGKGGEC